MKTIVHTLKPTHKEKTTLGFDRYEMVPVPPYQFQSDTGEEFPAQYYIVDGKLQIDTGDITLEASTDKYDNEYCYVTTYEYARWL